MSDLTFDFNRENPEVSLGSHIFKKRVELNASLEGKKSIYLDMNYWGYLCDVTIGKNKDPYLIALLYRLRELVNNGKAFCPLSSTTFFEIYKNRNNEIRKSTAVLVDELSLGVAIVQPNARMDFELQHLLFLLGYDVTNLEPQKLPWVRLSNFIGQYTPNNTNFNSASLMELQKSFFDFMWQMSMEKIVSNAGDLMLPPSHYSYLAAKLNEQNALHVTELESYQHTFCIEAQGMADAYSCIAAEDFNLERFKLKHSVSLHTRSDCLRLIIAYALKNSDYQNILRSAFITTCLHARLRWNKRQKFSKNDFEDYEHACAALGYCDFFLTERSLANALVSKPETLDKRFNCKIAYRPVDCLNELATCN